MSNYQAILGTLTARTGMHVGTGDSGDVSDALCHRTAAGDYLLPSTAIAGALRTLVTRLAPRLDSPVCRALWDQERLDNLTEEERIKPCGCWTCQLFGDINPDEGEEASGACASRLFVAHARAKLPKRGRVQIRDGVGIDRASRAAASAAAAKFDLEVLPKGTQFELRLELEQSGDAGVDRCNELLLAAVLAEWQAGRAWLGGRSSRGLGALQLESVRRVTWDLEDADTLVEFLQCDAPWERQDADDNWLAERLQELRTWLYDKSALDTTGEVGSNNCAHSFVAIEFELRAQTIWLSNDALAGAMSGFDHAPLLDVVARDGKPILPGASLRGVLRSQAERIARTLATLAVEDAKSFGEVCPACDPLRRPTEPEEKVQELSLASCDALLKALVPGDQDVSAGQLCLACRLFGSTRWGSRLRVEDAVAKQALNSDARQPGKVLDFLAIDRFTGGGKDGAKFDAFAAWQPVFPVRLYLENPQSWELGWLALVLRDLCEGTLPVSFGAAKGFGRVKAGALQVHYGFVSNPDFAGPLELAAKGAAGKGIYRELAWNGEDPEQNKQLLELAGDWLKDFLKQLEQFKREEGLQLTQDSYFKDNLKDNLASLYAKEAYEWLLKS